MKRAVTEHQQGLVRRGGYTWERSIFKVREHFRYIFTRVINTLISPAQELIQIKMFPGIPWYPIYYLSICKGRYCTDFFYNRLVLLILELHTNEIR